MNLKEILNRQTHLRAQIAIANRVIRFLNNFVSTQAAPAKEKMIADDGMEVTEEEIKGFINTITDLVIAPKRQELEKLMRLDLVEEVIAYIKNNPSVLPFALKQKPQKSEGEKSKKLKQVKSTASSR